MTSESSASVLSRNRTELRPYQVGLLLDNPFTRSSNGNLSATRKLLTSRWLTDRIIGEVRQLAKAVQNSHDIVLDEFLPWSASSPNDDEAHRTGEAVEN
jgi:hypothetical protein